MASRIIGLLMADLGISGELAKSIAPCRLPDRAGDAPAQPGQRPPFKRVGKVTPQVRALVVELLGNTTAHVVEVVREKLGVKLSCGTVYKVWRDVSLRGSVASGEGSVAKAQK